VSEPLVDPTVIVHAPHDDISEIATPHRQTPSSNSAFGWKITTFSLFVLVLVLAGYTGRTVYKSRSIIAQDASAISLSAAESVGLLGNYSSRCTDPWQYACGSYASKSLLPASRFGDAQARTDVEIAEVVQVLPESSLPRQFYNLCTMLEGHPVSFSRQNYTWWWDRGLEFGGLTFGRTRSNETRYRYLAVQISSNAGGDPQLGCAMAPESTCNGQLAAVSTRVGTRASFDSEICVLGGSPELACDIFTGVVSNRANNFTTAGLFDPSPSFCLRETKRLWPTATSTAWENVYSSDSIDAAVLDVFNRARAAIVHRLRDQNQDKLSAAVAKVQLHQHYTGPPEVYHSRMSNFGDEHNVFEWWETLMLEREEFDRSRLYFNKNDWDMSAHTINAYYWSYANAVFVTPAISRWMTVGTDEAELAGRLGFLLGHELGHAIHSNIDVLDDPAARAAYNAGRMCLTEEFGGSDLTTHEDMADRVGYGVVGAISQSLSIRSSTYCARDGCRKVDENHIAFLAAAQPFCATTANAETSDPLDPHSSNADRVRHSLKGTAAAANAWNCPVPSVSSLCPVVGAPTHY